MDDKLNYEYLRIISSSLIEKCKEGIKIIIQEDQFKKCIRTALSSTYPLSYHQRRSDYPILPSDHPHIVLRIAQDHQGLAFLKYIVLFPISNSFRIRQHSYLHWRTYTSLSPTSYFIETIPHISQNWRTYTHPYPPLLQNNILPYNIHHQPDTPTPNHEGDHLASFQYIYSHHQTQSQPLPLLYQQPLVWLRQKSHSPLLHSISEVLLSFTDHVCEYSRQSHRSVQWSSHCPFHSFLGIL